MEQLPAFTPINLFFYLILLTIIFFLFVKKRPNHETQEPKHVVVVGGGFAGIAAILKLRKHLYRTPVKITLVDRNRYHLFTPSLYEVATSEEPRKNVAIPFSKIFLKGVELLHNTVTIIDPATKTLTFTNKETLTYDYLILTAGSQPAFMGIPGLEKYSTGFKTLQDA